MSKRKPPGRKAIRFNTADKRKLLQQGRHLPTIGARSLKDLPVAYQRMVTDPKNRPWKITLWIRDKEEVEDFRPVTYFVRGADPYKAIAIAERFWFEVEKKALGLETERFPDALASGHATCLDEGDWLEYYEDAKKYGAKLAEKNPNAKMHLKGEPLHPMAFTVPGLVLDLENHQAPTDLDFKNSQPVSRIL